MTTAERESSLAREVEHHGRALGALLALGGQGLARESVLTHGDPFMACRYVRRALAEPALISEQLVVDTDGGVLEAHPGRHASNTPPSTLRSSSGDVPSGSAGSSVKRRSGMGTMPAGVMGESGSMAVCAMSAATEASRVRTAR